MNRRPQKKDDADDVPKAHRGDGVDKRTHPVPRTRVCVDRQAPQGSRAVFHVSELAIRETMKPTPATHKKVVFAPGRTSNPYRPTTEKPRLRNEKHDGGLDATATSDESGWP